jgi:hypothetical protein
MTRFQEENLQSTDIEIEMVIREEKSPKHNSTCCL